MSRTASTSTAAGLALAAFLTNPAAAPAAPLRYGGNPAELTVSAVGERTVRTVLAPLDGKGKPWPAPLRRCSSSRSPSSR
jgi:hypothetical protein